MVDPVLNQMLAVFQPTIVSFVHAPTTGLGKLVRHRLTMVGLVHAKAALVKMEVPVHSLTTAVTRMMNASSVIARTLTKVFIVKL